MKEQLSTREQQVLRAIINHYVVTAEPVSSRVLSEIYGLKASPATIRGVMNNLDQWGLLYQPHTSAGRVPSEIGYRVYVDNLLPHSAHLAAEMGQAIAERLEADPPQNGENLLHQVAQLLAALCGCIAIVTTPARHPDRVRHVQLVSLDNHQALLIVVSKDYQTESVRVEFPEDVADFLIMFNNFLNIQLRDRHCSALLPLDWDDWAMELGGFIRSLESSLRLLEKSYHQPGALRVSGLKELLKQPEFSQPDQFQPIVEFLEEDREAIVPLLEQTGDIAQIMIGKELGLTTVQNCSLISSMYRRSDAPTGWVSILGPTRLSYERAIAAVEAASMQVSEMLELLN